MNHSVVIRLFLAQATALSVLVGVFGCSSGNDGEEPSSQQTPATCPAVCERQKQLCQSNTDCELSCQLTDRLVAECGCQEEAQRSFDCLAKLNVCDADDTLCPPDEYSDCVTTLCQPATCSTVCERQNTLCGTQTDCSALCMSLNTLVARTGCRAEYQAGLDCLHENDVCDENETVCPSASLDACIQMFCQSNPADPACA